MTSFRTFATIAAVACLAICPPAQAQPALVASSPAATAVVSGVKSVTLTFSEALLPQLSGLEIVMTAMPGMAAHDSAMKIPGVKVSAGADGKSLVATLARPLPAGTYQVNWHAAGSDARRAAGTLSFVAR